jgi:hypothetical protein
MKTKLKKNEKTFRKIIWLKKICGQKIQHEGGLGSGFASQRN